MHKRRFVAVVFVLAVLVSASEAQIPRALSYQGVLTDSTGRPKPDGSYSFTFRLYPSTSGGTSLWTEIKTLLVSRGLFNTVLGDQVPVNLSFDGQYWLSIQVAAEPELSPRIPLTSAGYSIHSLKADTAQYAMTAPQQAYVDSARVAGTVSNGSITTSKLANGAVTTSKLSDGAVTAAKIPSGEVVKSLNGIRDVVTMRAQGGATITSSGDTIVINAGSGGGGTGVQSIQNTNNTFDITNPTGPTVTANLKVPLSLSANVSTANSAIITASNTAASNVVHGVIGRTSSSTTDAAGVLGEALANTGGTTGVIGRGMASSNGTGVAGFGASRGVYGESNLGYGVYGSSTSLVGVHGEGGTRGGDFSGGTYGVLATSATGWGVWGGTSSSTLNSTGVYGTASASSGEVYGIRGIATSSSQGTGVKGEGTLNGVVGTSSSASGVGVNGTGGQFGGTFTGGAYGVFGTGPLVGVWGVTNSTVSNSNAVLGVAVGSSGLVYGVKGVTNSTTFLASGVRGEATASSGQTIGVEGVSNASPIGTGVTGRGGAVGGYFEASAGTGVIGYGTTTGLFGQSFGSGGTGLSGYGTTGVYGESSAPGGTGVEGAMFANLNSSSWGVWGTTPAPGQAGHFSGNVAVVGNLSKTTGSFKIDHPLDPANKYLYHSFVESPDMMNIYNGNVVLDARGEAVVELATWFEALNKEFRYQLTCIGAFAPVYVAEEIQNNRFKIAGGKSGMKVSWQVTGIRHDAYADKHRIPVEEDKPSVERGHYLHPGLFGQPEEKSIEWAVKPEVMRRMKEEKENPKRFEIPTPPESPQNKDQR